MNIYVGNLAYAVTEDDLRESFGSFGELTSVNVITDKFSGQSKGFGFVEMVEGSEAADAQVHERRFPANASRFGSPNTPAGNSTPTSWRCSLKRGEPVTAMTSAAASR